MAACFASRPDFRTRFIFVLLIGRIYENLPVESRAPSPGRDTTAERDARSSTTYSSTNDTHAAVPAQLFHTAPEIAVRHHIIAFSFHHHHDIAFPLHVEEHLRLALALVEEREQRIDCAVARASEWDPYTERFRQWHSRFVQRDDLIGRDLWISAFFNAYATANQHRNLELHFLRKFPVGLGKNQQFHLPRHIFKRRLRPQFASSRFCDSQP